MTGAAPAVVELAANECWAVLRGAEVGRLAACLGAHPEIFPVNFVVDSGSVVFRSGEGTKISLISRAPEVAFEADGVDEATGDAWSVVAHGRAEQVGSSQAVEALALPLFPWQDGDKHRFVQLVPTRITGRRFHVVDRERWRTPVMDVRPAPPE